MHVTMAQIGIIPHKAGKKRKLILSNKLSNHLVLCKLMYSVFVKLVLCWVKVAKESTIIKTYGMFLLSLKFSLILYSAPGLKYLN